MSSTRKPNQHVEQLRVALLKLAHNRSYDDLLLIKTHIMKTEFFSKFLNGKLNPKQLNELCRQLSYEQFEENDFVFNQGDAGEKVYVILSGQCEAKIKYKIDLTLGQNEVREKSLGIMSEGQYFGERALQLDEPRSASIICLRTTELIVMSKIAYNDSMRNPTSIDKETQPKTSDQLGTRESVVEILSKNRNERNNRELEAVASYLKRRIQFFQKFSSQHLIELCRVAEALSIWGRSILFKQYQIGQAFYVIITGQVEVWVDDKPPPSYQEELVQAKLSRSLSKSLSRTNCQSPSNFSRRQSLAMKQKTDITDGLGKMVNQLVSGDQFGERALESESSQRMASIITGDGLTELLVITKEDYHNLVYMMMHDGNMQKLSLLRKTEMFRTVDVQHLKSLARYMEPRKYNLGDTVFKAGDKATEMIITETGECCAELELEEGYEVSTISEGFVNASTDSPSLRTSKDVRHHSSLHHSSDGSKSQRGSKTQSLGDAHKNKFNHSQSSSILTYPKAGQYNRMNLSNVKKITVNIGRIAPCSVIGAYITQCESMRHDVLHTETVKAVSLVNAFSIQKSEFFNHVPKDARVALTKIVSDFKTPILTPLWDNTAKVLDESVWKKEKTWKKFRKSLIENGANKAMDILAAQKSYSKYHLSSYCGNSDQSLLARKNKELMGSANVEATMGGDGALSSSQQNPADLIPTSRNNKSHTVTMDWGLSTRKAINAKHLTDSGRIPERRSLDSLPSNYIHDHLGASSSNLMNSILSRNIPQLESLNNSFTVTKRLNSSHSESSITTQNRAQFSEESPILSQLVNSYGSASASTLLVIDPSAVSNTLSNANELKQLEDSLFTNALDNGISSATRYPFSLVQVHRETGDKGMDSNRSKYYLRLCGSMKSCAIAKDYADMQVEKLFLTLYRSDWTKESELFLKWTPFKSFDAVSLQNSDHFFVYCRGMPIEVASFQPSLNIFPVPFPSSCKVRSQLFSCVLTNELSSDANPSNEDTRKRTRNRRQSPQEVSIADVVSYLESNSVPFKSNNKSRLGSFVSSGKDASKKKTDTSTNGETNDETSTDSSNDSDEKEMSERRGIRQRDANEMFKLKDGQMDTKKSFHVQTGKGPLEVYLGNTGDGSGSKSSSPSRSTSPIRRERSSKSNKIGKATTRRASISISVSSINTGSINQGKGSNLDSNSIENLYPGFRNQLITETSIPIGQTVKFRSEMSVVNEVLLTATSRIDCLKYAIKRFGEINPKSVEAMKSTNDGEERPGGQSVERKSVAFEMSNESSNIPLNSRQLRLRNPGTAVHNDRVLDLLLNTSKLVCVVPLYAWILINGSTVNDCNFLNAFNNSDQSASLNSEEISELVSSVSLHLSYQVLDNHAVFHQEMKTDGIPASQIHSSKMSPNTSNGVGISLMVPSHHEVGIKPSSTIGLDVRSVHLPEMNNVTQHLPNYSKQDPKLLKSLLEVGLMDKSAIPVVDLSSPLEIKKSLDWSKVGKDMKNDDSRRHITPSLHKRHHGDQTVSFQELHPHKEFIKPLDGAQRKEIELQSLKLLQDKVVRSELNKAVQRKMMMNPDSGKSAVVAPASHHITYPTHITAVDEITSPDQSRHENSSDRSPSELSSQEVFNAKIMMIQLSENSPTGVPELQSLIKQMTVESANNPKDRLSNRLDQKLPSTHGKKPEENGSHVEGRLARLNAIAAQQRVFIELHDNVCAAEHDVAMESHGYWKIDRKNAKKKQKNYKTQGTVVMKQQEEVEDNEQPKLLKGEKKPLRRLSSLRRNSFLVDEHHQVQSKLQSKDETGDADEGGGGEGGVNSRTHPDYVESSHGSSAKEVQSLEKKKPDRTKSKGINHHAGGLKSSVDKDSGAVLIGNPNIEITSETILNGARERGVGMISERFEVVGALKEYIFSSNPRNGETNSSTDATIDTNNVDKPLGKGMKSFMLLAAGNSDIDELALQRAEVRAIHSAKTLSDTINALSDSL